MSLNMRNFKAEIRGIKNDRNLEKISSWMLANHKYHGQIVKTWLYEIVMTNQEKKCLLFKLANDVLILSDNKAPFYKKHFHQAMPRCLSNLAKHCDKRTKINHIDSILQLWEYCGIYTKKVVKEFRDYLWGRRTLPSKKEREKQKRFERAKRLLRETKSPDDFDEILPNVLLETPNVDNLSNTLSSLDNAPSLDVKLREVISSLPMDVSNLNFASDAALGKNKKNFKSYEDRVIKADGMLESYNENLHKEVTIRSKLRCMLASFCIDQKDKLIENENAMIECESMLKNAKKKLEEMKEHVNSLPDIASLAKLAEDPLPPVNVLFTNFQG